MKATSHVALFRGINVGKAKRVGMAELRALIEELGYGNVRTLLNSGNVVFTATKSNAGKAAERIEKALATKLGISARVTVVTAAELAAVVAENPLLEIADDPARFLVAFLIDPADRFKLEPLLKQEWAPDMLAVGGRAAYVWCAGGILESLLLKAVGRVLKNEVTSRNWATVLKLLAVLQDRK